MRLPRYDLNPPLQANGPVICRERSSVSSENAFQESIGAPGSVAGSVGLNPPDELIAHVLAGDRKAIADFVEAYTDVVYNFLSRRIDRAEVIEDLCQEVFLAAWSQLARFRNESSLKTWLCAIARHKVADFYRRRLQEVPQNDADDEERMAQLEPAQVLDFEAHIDQQRMDAKIRAILSEMPEGYRAILRWRYWDHRSLHEIAAMTGKTEKAGERLLARARNDFARRWNVE